MQATYRFWHTNAPKNGFLGKVWMDISGLEIAGSVIEGKNGKYADFRNSPKVIDEAGKVSYGKPVVVLSDEVHQMSQAVIQNFWDKPVNSVTIASEDGNLKLVKGSKAQSKVDIAIEGAEENIGAALAAAPKTPAVQLPKGEASTAHENEDLPFDR